MRRRFLQQDVFTSVGYYGNPLAVVVDGAGLGDDDMARFARWTNLSETTFLLPPTDPEADYRVRIFTPSGELPFAGHPTLGTCHAWLATGGAPRTPGTVVQECGVGLVRVRPASDGGLAFAAPPLIRDCAVDEELLVRLATILGITRNEIVDSHWVDNGPGWVGVMLADAGAVLALRPGFVGELKVGVVGPYPDGHEFAYEVRAFFPKDGTTAEDPVTGSLNASVAQWLLGTGQVRAPYVASQGAALGRAGRVHIDSDEVTGDVWIGGHVVTCVDGHVEL